MIKCQHHWEGKLCGLVAIRSTSSRASISIKSRYVGEQFIAFISCIRIGYVSVSVADHGLEPNTARKIVKL